MNLFSKALIFASEKHQGQYRRTSNIPYILHPIEVATIVSTMTSDEEVMCAALLHDTVEDTDATMQDIVDNFGTRVAVLVASETEKQYPDIPAEDTWQRRKEDSLKVLKDTTDISVKIMWLADKLSNIRAFYRAYTEKGDKLWESFHQKDPAMQAWYYRTIAEYLSDLKDQHAYHEYVTLINLIFANVKTR